MLFGVSLATLMTWLACHFVGDFAFQSSWMAVEKGKSWQVNFYHCATYTAVFVLFLHPSIAVIMVLLVTHFVIDALKARYHLINAMWVDQLLHLLTIALIVWLHL